MVEEVDLMVILDVQWPARVKWKMERGASRVMQDCHDLGALCAACAKARMVVLVGHGMWRC